MLIFKCPPLKFSLFIFYNLLTQTIFDCIHQLLFVSICQHHAVWLCLSALLFKFGSEEELLCSLVHSYWTDLLCKQRKSVFQPFEWNLPANFANGKWPKSGLWFVVLVVCGNSGPGTFDQRQMWNSLEVSGDEDFQCVESHFTKFDAIGL